jgi:hypothetical protein
MSLRALRFASIMMTSVSLSAALAHAFELPYKMRYGPELYVQLHRTLYWNFGRVGGTAEILALLGTAGLAGWTSRKHPAAFPLTALAAGCLIAAHGAFWALVEPANKTMASWPMDAIPAEWTAWRNQWEYTHAARAALVLGALGALVTSVLRETPERTGFPHRISRA